MHVRITDYTLGISHIFEKLFLLLISLTLVLKTINQHNQTIKTFEISE